MFNLVDGRSLRGMMMDGLYCRRGKKKKKFRDEFHLFEYYVSLGLSQAMNSSAVQGRGWFSESFFTHTYMGAHPTSSA